MNKNVLVTAARGNIGRELIPLLKKRGVNAIPGVRDKSGNNKGFDFTKEDTIRSTLKENKIESVCLIVPEEITKEQTVRALQIMKEENVKRVVAIAGNGFADSESRKVNFEEGTSALLPNWFMQNYNQMFLKPIKNENRFLEPVGDKKTPFIDARDIALCALELLLFNKEKFAEYANRTIYITGPEAIERSVVAKALNKATGRDIKYQPCTKEEFVENFVKNDVSSKEEAEFIASVYDMTFELEDGKTVDLSALSNEVFQITGKKPYNIEEFAQHYAADWK